MQNPSHSSHLASSPSAPPHATSFPAPASSPPQQLPSSQTHYGQHSSHSKPRLASPHPQQHFASAPQPPHLPVPPPGLLASRFTSAPAPPPGARPAVYSSIASPAGQLPYSLGNALGASPSLASSSSSASAPPQLMHQQRAGVTGGGMAEPEWRESSFIASFYGGGGGGTPNSDPPTSPSNRSYFPSSSSSSTGAPPPRPPSPQRGPSVLAPPSQHPSSSSSSFSSQPQTGFYQPSQPAYPAYAIARSTSITSSARPAQSSPSSYPSSSRSPPAPPQPPQLPQQAPPPRESSDSARYSIYSFGSEGSGPGAAAAGGGGAGTGSGFVGGFAAERETARDAYGTQRGSNGSYGAGGSGNGNGQGSGFSRSSSMGTFYSSSASARGAGAGGRESNGSYGAGGAANGGGQQQQQYPSRKQSLEHFRKAAAAQEAGWRTAPGAARARMESYPSISENEHFSSSSVGSGFTSSVPPGASPPLTSSTTSHSSFGASTSSRDNRTGSSSLSPKPSIIMSPPPLDSPIPSSSISPSQLPRNRSIDSSWSSRPGPSSSPSLPSFASHTTASPSPSPSMTFTASPDSSRRPSYATLSPHTSLSTHSAGQNASYGGVFGGGIGENFSSPSPRPDGSFPPFGASTTSIDGGAGGGGRSEFLDPSLLSNLALFLKDAVPRSSHRKSSAGQGERTYEASFTGEEIVSTLVSVLYPSSSASSLPENDSLAPPSPSASASASNANGLGISSPPFPSSAALPGTPSERQRALEVARTLQQSLWFSEVSWSDAPVLDNSSPASGLYVFLEGEEGELLRGGGGEGDGEDLPTGVLTEWTKCYSPMCGVIEGEVGGVGQDGCYAYGCPNRRKSSLHRTGSTLSAVSGVEQIESAENWATSVPASLLESLPKEVVKCQNNIFELISGEQSHYDDLQLLETGFIQPLLSASPPIIPPSRLPLFLSSLLLNVSTIRSHSSSLLSALREKQSDAPVVSGIGKIVFAAAVEWGREYVEYGKEYPMASWVFKEECATNSRFAEFVQSFSRLPAAQRRDFEAFHKRPWTRLTQYTLLLQAVLDHTDADARVEKEYLQQAIDVIKGQIGEVNKGLEETMERVGLRSWGRDLVMKQEGALDLELNDPSRKFFLAGKVYRRVENPGFADQFQEAHLVLFDNYLVLAKAPRPDRDGRMKYAINRRPVPLELVQLKTSSFSEPPIPRTSGFHLRSNRSANGGGGGGSQPSPYIPDSAPSSGPLVYPLTFHQLGRFNGLVHLYVDVPSSRAEWEKQLKAAISLCLARQEARRVVRLDPLADQTFGSSSLTVGSLTAPTPTAPGNQFGKPTCSVPLRTVDGLWLIIAGCQEGIFIGWRGRPKTMQQVVHLAGITQCSVLPEFSFLLVIANKVLVAYALEALIPSKTGSKLDQASKAPQRLSGQKDVSFFKTGKIGDADPRTLVIYAKKSGVKESVFKALEPVSQAERARGGGGGGHRFLGLGGGRPEWFRTYKEFFMPSLVTGLHFQRSKLALIGSRGVEIMDLESMRTMTVPDFPSSRGDRALASLAKRCEDVPTMGMFRIADSKFLLVYSEFAFHVGRHGEPVPGPFIEWESKPEQVAYCAPYIFAISPTLVEIRNAFTGRLAQFIIGSHMSLTYDGSAIPTLAPPSPSPGGGAADDLAGPVDKRLHLSIRQGQYHVLHEVVVVA
ncbi:hypothetical protein JCM8547_002320 [Rhodosporidiobolus lusitaniae]